MLKSVVELLLVADNTALRTGVEQSLEDIRKEAKLVGNDISQAFARASNQADKLNDELEEGIKDNKEMSKALKQTLGIINNLIQREQALINARNRSNNPAAIARFNKLIVDTRAEMVKLTGATEKQVKATGKLKDENKKLETGLNDLQNKIIAYFTVDKLVEFAKKVVAVRAEFQKFEAVLTNTLGSKSLAQAALKQIQDFAAQTPFGVAELTASFVKLANQGFEPTIDEMRNLGDIAAAQGKTFDQLTEAIIDAQTGEFERLKEFGIRASKEGSNVTFSFKGVQTQTKFTNDAIREYILSLGELEGVTGGMAAISKTLGGQLSNLDDNFDALFNNLGKNAETGFAGVFDLINSLLTETNDVSGRLLRVQDALKGTGFDLGNLEATFTGAAGGIGGFQKILEDITKTAGAFKKESDFVPLYANLNTVLRLVNKEYEKGSIDLEEYNRRLILVSKQVLTLDEQRQHMLEQQAAAAERAKTKTADKLKEEERLNKERLKHSEDFLKAQEDLNKRLEKLQIDNEKDREYKIYLETQFNLHEIDLVEKHFVELGKLADANFKLSTEQQRQFEALRYNIRKEGLDKLLDLHLENQRALAAIETQRAEGNVGNITSEETNAINAVKLAPNATGLSEEKFELQKQVRILEIQRSFAARKLEVQQALLKQQYEEEAAGLRAELSLLGQRNDDEARIKRLQIEQSLQIIEDKFTAENTKIQDETAIQIGDLTKQIQTGIKQLNQVEPFNLLRLFGVDTKDQQAVQEAVDSVKSVADAIIEFQNQILDNELARIQAREQARQDALEQSGKGLSDLETQLKKEEELRANGAANNAESIKLQIENEKALREQALQEEEKINEKKKNLAKVQLLTDSIVQASNLITASSNILLVTSTLGPAGVVAGQIAVAAMIAAFAITKATALARINDSGGPGFKEGGYTGDAGTTQVAGVVHGQEFVHTAESTKAHRELFDAIHTNDEKKYRSALLKELAGTGVLLEPDLPSQLENGKQIVRNSEINASIKTDNSGMERELREIKGKFDNLLKTQKVITYNDPAGNLIIRKGNNTTIIKKNR